jgi:Fe2+ or Zn2+ uptake regulation protein
MFLRQRHHRLTAPRQAIFLVLQAANKPLTMGELSKHCAESDRSSIYRALLLFETLGIITIIHRGWKKLYELSGPFKPHHHHLECTECDQLIAIDAPRLESYIESVAETHGYTLVGHHVELRGICKNCQQKSTR